MPEGHVTTAEGDGLPEDNNNDASEIRTDGDEPDDEET